MTYKEQMDQEYVRGRKEGIEQGIEQGIRAFIKDKLEDKVPAEIIKSKLCKSFCISEEKADDYISKVVAESQMA